MSTVPNPVQGPAPAVDLTALASLVDDLRKEVAGLSKLTTSHAQVLAGLDAVKTTAAEAKKAAAEAKKVVAAVKDSAADAAADAARATAAAASIKELATKPAEGLAALSARFDAVEKSAEAFGKLASAAISKATEAEEIADEIKALYGPRPSWLKRIRLRIASWIAGEEQDQEEESTD